MADATPADPWPDFSTPAARCPEPTCREWSPELPDHHAAADWAETHDCQSTAASERTAA